MLITLPLLLAAAAALGYATLGWRRGTCWGGAAAAAGTLACGIAALYGPSDVTALDGLLRADRLSAFWLIVVAVVFVTAMTASPAYWATAVADHQVGPRTTRWFGVLTMILMAAVVTAVTAADLWLFATGTAAAALVTPPLVGCHRTLDALRAARAYAVIVSLGVAAMLLGTVLPSVASRPFDARSAGTALLETDPADTTTVIAVGSLLLGLLILAGLAPALIWLPEALAQAPAPVAALMWGTLPPAACYGLLRVLPLADTALGQGIARGSMLVVAVAAMTLSTAALVRQRDYKRMVAYCGGWHLGLIVLGFAVGVQAVTAATAHLLNLSLALCVLFLASGHIWALTGSSRIDSVRGLWKRSPLLGGVFTLGVLTLVGIVPFGLVFSGWGIVQAGFGTHPMATAIALAGWPVVMISVVRLTLSMSLGDPASHPYLAAGTARPLGSAGPVLALGVAACAAAGVSMALLWQV